MIKHLIAIMAVALSATATAQVSIERHTLGSGQQGVKGFENATLVLDNNIFHAPQYMPQYPTAATIWPRVVEVKCVRVGTSVVASVNTAGVVYGATNEPMLQCEGYDSLPALGRGEYLFFKPVIAQAVPIEVRERIILKEVPVKKVRQ